MGRFLPLGFMLAMLYLCVGAMAYQEAAEYREQTTVPFADRDALRLCSNLARAGHITHITQWQACADVIDRVLEKIE